jgi:hypothetical protein
MGFLFTLGSAGDKVAFQPEAGASLTKTFTIAGDFALDEMSMVVDGQDLGAMIGQFEISMKQESKIEVTDVYKAVGEGRPTELLRTFEALAGSMQIDVTPAPAEMPEMATTSPLEGKTVAFRWDAEKNEYERSFHESEGEEDLLEDLEEDMDLRVFLPDSEVAQDDSWSVELAELECIAMPGGNLSMQPENMPDVDPATMEMFEEMFGDLGDDFGDLLEGECTCTYKGTREENGARVAEIAIEIDVAATVDLAEVLEKAIRAAIEMQGEGIEVDLSLDQADLNLDFEGSATLLWDLKAGRLHSFQLGGDATIGLDLAVSMEAEGESHGVDASFELSGELRQEVVTKE